MSWHDLLPLAVFAVTFLASLFSGMAGGGGGFIINPFLILIGLTPQQTVATSKFGSFGLIGGAVTAFKGKMFENKRLSALIISVAVLMGIIAGMFVQKIDNQSLQMLMGILTLAMVPFMIRKSLGVKTRKTSRPVEIVGTIILAVVLLLQGILSGGIGSLVSVIFIVFFGVTALEANVLKRKASLVLNIVVVASLLTSGLINFTYGLFGMAGGFLGGYAGSHIALRKGEGFAKYALLVFMIVSGIYLIATAN